MRSVFSLRNLPHAVTISRGVAGPVVLALLLLGRGDLAFPLFVVAALTDLIDGWMARRLGSDPRIGLVLDVASDRVLGFCSWLGLLLLGWAPAWLVLLLWLRDLVVVALWIRTRKQGRRYRPSMLGQIATSFEGASLGILLFHGPWIGVHWPSVGAAVGISALLSSVVSGLAYLRTTPEVA